MKNQSTSKQNINDDNPWATANHPGRSPAPVFFSEEELLGEIEAGAFCVSLSAGPESSLSPALNPEEIEFVYLWFYS